jgi:2,4-dienoyl-CoA reductase (NADPH2)
MRHPDLNILFEPLKMSNLELKNRFFMAPMGTTFDLNRLKDYLVARAKGGVALITTPEISVHESGRVGLVDEPRFENDGDIRTLAPLAEAVKKAGAKIVAQLNHAGRYAFARVVGRQSVAPSAIASRYTNEMPRELSTNEVDDLVVAFSEAALRAKKAGFDGVEFMACSGYLISEFLSPLTNRRTDRYGGGLLQRATFLLSLLKETRSRVGEDFNICVKIDAEDGMKGGKTLEDSMTLAPRIVSDGADRLHVWAGWHEASRPMLPMSVPRGGFSYLSAAIKNAVSVPVSTVGRINDPFVAADILARGDADLIGLGRALLCDPDFVGKTQLGKVREIRRCTACCHCFDLIMRAIRGDMKADLACSINPELGHEGEGLLEPAARGKRVMVIGGGPAGLEAARVCALRGHQVTLYDKENGIGGMLSVADKPPHKEEIRNIIDYYEAQMETLGVDLRLNTPFTAETWKQTALQPDAVILATGAEESLPDIPGIRGVDVLTAIDVLKGTMPAQTNVAIVGGGMIGVETAEFLAEAGKTVTLIEMLDTIASDVGVSMRWDLLSRIKKKATILTSTRVTEIAKGFLKVAGEDGGVRDVPADAVVIATGMTSRRGLASFLNRTGVDFYNIGSSREPGQIVQAVNDGFNAARKI